MTNIELYDSEIAKADHFFRQLKAQKKEFEFVFAIKSKKSGKVYAAVGGKEDTIKNLMAQDAEVISRGETPERRLIPHHAIKRDVIIAAYNKDFQVAVTQIQEMDWTENEKDRRLSEINEDFDKQIYGIKRLGQDDLDKIIALMKKTRTDLVKIEASVRSENSIYKIVDPLT
ncbi:MAG: hypothetical protein L3J74_05455 [Bacteroidales bacterium]|nr:hypothetical protein [Bacteroidales bacterium]